MDINLEILFEKTDKTVNSMLTIEPLAPLSMVSTMPGSFYKTLSVPSKYHLCGAFENALGWHFDESLPNRSEKKENLRRLMKKQIEAKFKKMKIDSPIWEESDVGYQPLIDHLFDIGLVCKPAMIFYKDLWKQMRKRSDGTYPHPNGTMNLSYDIIPLKMDLERDAKKGTVTSEAIGNFYKENQSSYPLYYTSAGNREFIAVTEGVFKLHLKMSEGLFDALYSAFIDNNISYLGTNEGWVNFKIQKL